eukprot:1131291-Pyramimonas_sp.AAC.1
MESSGLAPRRTGEPGLPRAWIKELAGSTPLPETPPLGSLPRPLLETDRSLPTPSRPLPAKVPSLPAFGRKVWATPPAAR